MNLAILQLVQQEQSKQTGYQRDQMRLHMEPSISVLRPASLSHAYFQSCTWFFLQEQGWLSVSHIPQHFVKMVPALPQSFHFKM